VDITVINEGTYPYHLGGVSVWCDQLVRQLAEYRFHVLAIVGAGDEDSKWAMPTNVASLDIVPLWEPGPTRRASRTLVNRFLPVEETFFRSLAVGGDRAGFVSSLRDMAGYARSGQLNAAMSSEAAVELLLAINPVCCARPGAAEHAALSVGDAVDVLLTLEHFLRPLGHKVAHTDVCHLTASGLGTLIALNAKWEWGTPLLLTEHGVYLRELYLSYKPGSLSHPARAIVLRFFKLLVEASYGAADIVAPVCRYNGLWEVANGTPTAHIRPVHNGIDPLSFPNAPSEPEVPTVVWVGRVDPLKDLETLIRAFAEVRAAVPQCRLRLFGPVPKGGEDYFRRCLQLASDLGLEDGAATFDGPVQPSAQAYHAGHVVALTSISEGLPYVLLEAMACGRAVVATDVGGVAEAVGDAGVLVPPRDAAAVAAACVRLLTHADERQALGAAARRRVSEFFTTEHCFEMYRGLYEELRPRANAGLQPAELDGADEDGAAGAMAAFQCTQLATGSGPA
jgi:polysaccharide biosynthesis protein PelF